MKTNLIALRRLDVSDSDNPTYYTYYIHGEKRRGCFHRCRKEHLVGDTSIRQTKGTLYEVRVHEELDWKTVGRGEFGLWLSSFNAIRKERGWEPIVLSD